MTGLTVGTRVALAQVIEAIPDDALSVMRAAVAQMGGERAAELVVMLEDAVEDRHRRATAFGALIPVFRARRDGLDFLRFPASVLPRLWRLAAERDPILLPMLDSLNDEDSSRRALARGRLYGFAAEIVRTRPEAVWPAPTDDAGIAARETGLAELAACCDMGPLIHRATRDLIEWIDRPDEDRLTEFRLMVRDAARMDIDGVRRLLDVMAAHVEDASRILHLSVHAGGTGAEARLRHSELAVIVERILDGFEERARRIGAFQAGDAIGSLKRDLTWMGAVLDAMAVVVHADPQGDWARRVAAAKGVVTRMMDDRLGAAGRTLAKVMPTREVQTAGRMVRRTPSLEVEVSEADFAAAAAAADLIAVVRFPAGRFGCEARRQTVLKALIIDLAAYADMVVEALNSGEAAYPAEAAKHAGRIADLLERLEAETEARTLRRRIAALRPGSGAIHAA